MQRNKKVVNVLLFMVFTFAAYAQEFSVSIQPAISTTSHFQMVTGGPETTFKPGIILSAEYIFRKETKLSFGTKLDWQYASVKVKPAYWGQPEEQRTAHVESANLISAGIISRLLIKKSYLMLESFLAYHINGDSWTAIGNQTGIGFAFSWGKNIDLNERIFLKLQPELRVNNVIPFIDKNLPNRLTSLGLKIGVGLK